jgi:hypothetical protein
VSTNRLFSEFGLLVEFGLAAFVGYAAWQFGGVICSGSAIRFALAAFAASMFIAFVGQAVEGLRQIRLEAQGREWLSSVRRMRLRVFVSVTLIYAALFAAFIASTGPVGLVCAK